ncbi:MAG TPA: hypothetical protein VK845_05260, partial [Gemmatimonadales bacterium]|nr:hypothetical protein [Gemmatimonadales bacterium]
MTRRRRRARALLAILSGGILWVSAAGGSLANQSVYNESGSALIMEGELGDAGGHHDEIAPAHAGPATGGFVQAWQVQGDPGFLSVGISSFVETLCEGDPLDPEDDYIGLVGTVLFAVGEATLDVGRRYDSGTASTTTDVYRATFNDCTGEYEESVESGVTLTLTMLGEGDLIRESGTTSFHDPGDSNWHDVQRSVYRWATGTLSIGSEIMEVAFGR